MSSTIHPKTKSFYPTILQVRPTTSRCRPLPQEILEKIIDLVAASSHYPYVELQNCALTSKAWRIRSQFHQHKAKYIVRADDGNSLVERYRGTRLAGYVRSLILEGKFDGDSFYELRWKPFQEIFPYVDHLHLKDVFHRITIKFPSPTPTFPQLTSLSLWWVTFPTCGSFITILRTLPNLSYLKLGRIKWHCVDHPEDTTADLRTQLNLKRLEIESSEGLEELDCVDKHLDLSRLEVVRLYWLGGYELRRALTKTRIDKLTHKARASLQSLTLVVKIFSFLRKSIVRRYVSSVLTFYAPAVDPGYTRLTVNSRLEDLTIGVLDLAQTSSPKVDYNWILDTLSDLSPTRFRQCKILLRIEDMSRFSDVPWNRIDNALCGSRFTAFETMTIAITDRSWLPWVTNDEPEKIGVSDVLPVARHLLPKLTGRNALEVVGASQYR